MKATGAWPYWRCAHQSYSGRLGRYSDDMMLMCERFRLVEVFSDGPGGGVMQLQLNRQADRTS